MAQQPRSNINGVAITVTLAGAVLLYSAVKNKTITVTLKDLLAGQPVPNDTSTAALGGTGGGAVADTPNPLPNSGGGNFSYIVQVLTNLGFTHAGVAGALGNMHVETGGTFATTASNPNEGAIGWCQWEGGRRTGLRAYAAARGLSETDPKAQAGWMRTELLSAYADVYLYMRSTGDPQAAAAYWDAHYEKSSGAARSEREQYAQQIYGQLYGHPVGVQ